MDPTLVPLEPDVLDALAETDVPLAAALLGLPVEAALADETWLFQLRREQLTHTPDDRPWLARLLVVDGRVVGHAGFHAAPDEDGVVELGYWVAPAHRRRGLGAAALRLLEAWGRAAPEVTTLRACVGLANDASTRLVERAAYVRTGVEVDPVDGDEAVYELDVR